jgi:nanoRNase/pAp phosphatase (c-di-AMP/oligoRNAs hydrolase)
MLFKKDKNYILTTHVGPDIDAVISTILMGLILEKMGVKFEINFVSKPEKYLEQLLKEYFDYKIKIPEEPCIVVDVAAPSQLKIKGVLKGVCFDHHESRIPVCTKEIVKIRTSCAEVIYEQFKGYFDKNMLLLLGCAIYHDSGYFNTFYPKTCDNLKDVLRYYDINHIKEFIKVEPSEDELKNMLLSFKNSLLIKTKKGIVLLSNVKNKAGEIASKINIYDYVIIIKDSGRVSLRGHNCIDFAKFFVEKFGGKFGGHKNACALISDPNELKQKMLEAIDEYFRIEKIYE